MKQFYLLIVTLTLLLPFSSSAQNCIGFSATFKAYESRCAATGAIKVAATGGSGSYKYRVSGPVNLNFTSVDSITGLAAGTYTIEVVDINNGCQFFSNPIHVPGSYSDPRFILNTVDVSCNNGSNGSIQVANLENGRGPFQYTIVAPSASGIGTTNTTGFFDELPAGNYTIRLTDSCGGIQTRATTIQNYTWGIQSADFQKTSCTDGAGVIKAGDSRGRFSDKPGGIPGLQYGIVFTPGDTTWSATPNFTFNASGVTSLTAVVKDACGVVQSQAVSFGVAPSVEGEIAVSNKTCSTFTATVTGLKNYVQTPIFLINGISHAYSAGSPNGVFPNLPYGTYSVNIMDVCSFAVVTKTVTASPPPVSVAPAVNISNKECNTFTATITGQVNTTSPQYQLFDKNNVLISTNTTGIFTGLAYGNYCIDTKDGCVDTTIRRCFDVVRPIPRIDSLTPSYVNCSVFSFNVNGDSLYSAQYCLYDNEHNLIECNATGSFSNVPLGGYCVQIYDACLDTTITRCINVDLPTLTNDMVVRQTRTCATFTATVQTSNIVGGYYTLYDVNHNVIASNSTGVFTNLPYGEYCIYAKAVCPDTTVFQCFTAINPVPSISPTPTISNRRCDLFDIEVAGRSNLTSPIYRLKNSVGTVIASGSSPKFTNLPYGEYCIEVENSCYDTIMTACATVTPPEIKLTSAIERSCYYGYTKITVSSNVYPADVMIMDPANVMVRADRITAPRVFDSLPNLNFGGQYKIRGVSTCTTWDSLSITPVVAFLDHSAAVQQVCPGSVWPNGSGNIIADVTTNAGVLTVRIVSKDNVPMDLTPSTVFGSVYSFNDLGPGTYVLRYNTSDGCNVYRYDTVSIAPYQFPSLDRTSAFQCDVDGFSVGAYVNNGVGPFTYEIMSSTPSTPSIASPPQSSPVFNINNGTDYQLIRLRALDACGNATLGDASILPLASNKIKGITDNCIGTQVTLSIDTMINSVVSWSYKKNKTDALATPLGTGSSYQINPFTYSDIGFYYCEVVMNNGCVTRNYEFELDGVCHGVLPVIQVNLKGRMLDEKSVLEWSIDNGNDLMAIFVERRDGKDYKQIGKVDVRHWDDDNRYKFTDEQPAAENDYRLRLVFQGGKTVYSKVVHLTRPRKGMVNVYPNPATDFVTIDFNSPVMQTWQVELISLNGQKTFKKETVTAAKYTIQRTASIVPGMYILKVTNSRTGNVDNYKVVFK